MAIVKNLSKEIITSITAGNIAPGEEKKIADWEVALIENMLGKKIAVLEEPASEQKKKGKK